MLDSSQFAEYASRYEAFLHLEFDAGLLMVTFHSEGGPFVFNRSNHASLGRAFADIARDPGVHVVILTGSGDEFMARARFERQAESPSEWDVVRRDATRILESLMDIEAPVIAAVNGPATVHSEIAMLSDIVLATHDAEFGDSSHAANGIVPADGVQIVWQQLVGPNRSRHLLLTGQTITAQDALALGVVAELVARDSLMPRARQIAAMLLGKPPLMLRHTRLAFTTRMKRALADDLTLGLALEALAAIDLRQGRSPKT